MNDRHLPIGGARDLAPQRIAITDIVVIPIASLQVATQGVADLDGDFTLALVDVMRGKRMLIPYERKHLQTFIDDVQDLLNATADNGENGGTQHD